MLLIFTIKINKMKDDKSIQSFSPEMTITNLKQALLGQIFTDINERSKNLFNMYTLSELTSFPLIFCQKLTQSLTLNQSDLISKDQFVNGFYTLYFGSIEDIANLIGRICNFKHNLIWIKDIKLLLLHFHMHLMTNETEKQLTQIVDSFFNDDTDKKTDYYITVEEFVSRSINCKRDIISIFMAYLRKYSFFNEDHLDYFSSAINNKASRIPIAKCTNEKISNDCLMYIESIETTSVTQDPFDDDLETLESISTFESEISVTLSSLSDNQIDFSKTDFHCSNTERRASDFSDKAKHLFQVRTDNKTKSVKSRFINPIRPNREPRSPLHEITLYYQSSKDKRMKMVKLVQIAEMIFYWKYSTSLKEFVFQKVIMIKMLFPKLTPDYILQNKAYFQLELLSSIHNQLVYRYFFSQNEDELNSFVKEIINIQNIKTIEDHFEIGDKVGSGKFGKVVHAKHIFSGKEYAIKIVCKSDKDHSEKTFYSYKWEKDIGVFLKNVSCDYIGKFYGIIESANYLYFVTEYVPNGSLKELTKESSALTWNGINEICTQLIKGVSVLHQYGIIHRDIKPANTLVSLSEKGKVNIKIIDFGLSKVIGVNEKAQERFGSLSFKAPEIILGKDYSFEVDIWAIGITAYYLAFREFPVKASNKNMLKKRIVNKDYTTLFPPNSSLDNFLFEIIHHCLVKEPQKRLNINKLLKSLMKSDL